MDKYRSDVLKFVELVRGGRFICFDTETTGLSPTDNDIIQFSAIRYEERGGEYAEVERFNTYINPGYPIAPEITEINGITNEMLEKAPGQKEAAAAIKAFLGDSPILIGYNSISFDEEFVKSLYRKTGMGEFTPSFHLDILKMAREKSPKPHKLIDMAERAGVTEGLTFHSSDDDAIATFEVFLYLLPMYEKAEPRDDMAQLRIMSIRRWTKSATLDRLYVGNTKNFSIYLDIPKGEWFIGANLETDDVVAAVYDFAKVMSDDELIAKYS